MNFRKTKVCLKVFCIVFLLLMIGKPFQSKAQLSYSNEPVVELLAQAKQKRMLLMLVIESVDCDQCNEVATIGLNDTESHAYIKSYFLIKKSKRTDIETDSILNAIELPNFSFGLVFLTADGDLIYYSGRSTTTGQSYLQWARTAVQKKYQAAQLAYLSKELKKQPDNFNLLREYTRYYSYIRPVPDELIDQYTAAQLQRAVDSASFALILQVGYSMFSKTHQMMDTLAAKDVWLKKMPLPLLNHFKSAFISRSKWVAQKEKSPTKAMQVAALIEQQYKEFNPLAFIMKHEYLLEFYSIIKDTSAYFNQASFLYRNGYTQLNQDSLKQKDDMYVKEQFKNLPKDTVRLEGGGFLTKQISMLNSPMVIIGNKMNECAMQLLRFHPFDKNYQQLALNYAQYATKFLPINDQLLLVEAHIAYCNKNSDAALKKLNGIKTFASDTSAGTKYWVLKLDRIKNAIQNRTYTIDLLNF